MEKKVLHTKCLTKIYYTDADKALMRDRTTEEVTLICGSVKGEYTKADSNSGTVTMKFSMDESDCK